MLQIRHTCTLCLLNIMMIYFLGSVNLYSAVYQGISQESIYIFFWGRTYTEWKKKWAGCQQCLVKQKRQRFPSNGFQDQIIGHHRSTVGLTTKSTIQIACYYGICTDVASQSHIQVYMVQWIHVNAWKMLLYVIHAYKRPSVEGWCLPFSICLTDRLHTSFDSLVQLSGQEVWKVHVLVKR